MASFPADMEPSQLDTTIEATREDLIATLQSDPDWKVHSTYLLAALRLRSARTGSLDDLNEAIDLARQVTEALDDNHQDQVIAKGNLSALFKGRFAMTSNMADLDEAIRLVREAIALVPEGDQERAIWLNNLAVFLKDKFESTGNIRDLDSAIEVGRQAEAAIPDHPDRAGVLNSLAGFLQTRFNASGAQPDLDESIQIAREIVRAGSPSSSSRAKHLSMLGISLYRRFARKGFLEDLEEAIDSVRKAVTSTDPNDLQQAMYLSTLGVLLKRKFQETKNEAALDDAINVSRRSVKATPSGHPDLAGRLNNFSSCLHARFNDLRLAYQYDCEALSLPTAPTSERLFAARHLFASPWAHVTPNDAVEYADKALQLLPQLTPNFLQHEDKQHLLLKAAWLASDVVAISLLAMDERADEASVEGTLAKAVTWLEMGRGVLASGIRDMRTDMSALTQQHPNLAQDFNDSKLVLGAPVPSILSPEEDSQRKASIEHEKRRQAQDKLSSTIAEIRKQPGFERFLTFPSQAEILKAAAYGPIIIVNISLHRSDLLIISITGIRHIKLSDNVYKETSSFSEKVSSQPSTMFHWMWDSIVGPALDHLGFCDTLPVEQQPHVWWIPTGPLVGFPLHAAGYHLEKKGRTALDRVVSSYATSVRSIIQARQTSPSKPVVPSLVLVAMDQTPGLGSGSYLKYAKSEIQAVQEFGRSMNIQSTSPLKQKEPVLSALNKCEIFHFAGHGYAHTTQPLLSHLLLEDWEDNPLTVENLLDINLDGSMPFLAYLSACGTGQILNEKSMDESIHLSSACQLSGFRHVIGTLWSVEDELCVTMAKRVYKTLAARGLEDAAVGYGLHLASRQFRDEWVQGLLPTLSTDKKRYVVKRNQPEWGNMSWVPYVHYGV
ncbi:TPR domain-containing protein [Fusarium circinatum]|uniref:TPR domain-containing protein n=1 Tax=Fusarium circinatum TaxID=48490 RepID=A0A8H5T7M3_FUSCI|nr:TPR domain-containing protein [Fusarium circinatum]